MEHIAFWALAWLLKNEPERASVLIAWAAGESARVQADRLKWNQAA